MTAYSEQLLQIEKDISIAKKNNEKARAEPHPEGLSLQQERAQLEAELANLDTEFEKLEILEKQQEEELK